MISLLSFAWAAELSKEVAGLAGYDGCLAASPVCMPAKLLAVLSILGINVSVQAVQAGALWRFLTAIGSGNFFFLGLST